MFFFISPEQFLKIKLPRLWYVAVDIIKHTNKKVDCSKTIHLYVEINEKVYKYLNLILIRNIIKLKFSSTKYSTIKCIRF